MRLYIVRHGYSKQNAGAYDIHDSELTPTGKKQARQAAKWLSDKGIDEILTSPAVRTLQTSNIIGDYLKIKPRLWMDIVEYGYLEDDPGLTKAEIIKRFPNSIADALMDGDAGWASHMITGESPEMVSKRAIKFKDELFKQYLDTQIRICMVTHYGFANFFLGALLNIDMNNDETHFVHYNCGIDCLELSGRQTKVLYLNYHGHLTDLT